MTRRGRLLRRSVAAGVLVLAAGSGASAHAQDFAEWLAGFRSEALAAGIRAETFDAAFADARPVEHAITLDRKQPEFVQTFSDYVARRVTPSQVARGQALLAEHAALLSAVESSTGVPAAVLVAFWGLETNYGRTLGSFNVPVTLATLAWEGRRSSFFRRELLAALDIAQQNALPPAAMVGSWAGAMGQMQFMPSTWRAHAVDGDGDGRIDLWNSLPDALHSAGRYLQRAGWKSGEPIALEVTLPQGYDLQQARVSNRRPLTEWRAAGLQPAHGAWPQAAGAAGLVLPQGWQGPAYLVFRNFDAAMNWNRSVNYALAVGQLASELAGGPAFVPVASAGALSFTQVAAMQQALNELGFEAGEPDGLIGPLTQSALRRFQLAARLPVDGYPSPAVFEAITTAHSGAKAAGKLPMQQPPAM